MTTPVGDSVGSEITDVAAVENLVTTGLLDRVATLLATQVDEFELNLDDITGPELVLALHSLAGSNRAAGAANLSECVAAVERSVRASEMSVDVAVESVRVLLRRSRVAADELSTLAS